MKILHNMYLNEDGSITENSSKDCVPFKKVYLLEKGESLIPNSEFIAPESMILPFPTDVVLPDKIQIEILEGRYQLTKIFRDGKVIWEKQVKE